MSTTPPRPTRTSRSTARPASTRATAERHAQVPRRGAVLGLRLPHHRRPLRRSHQRDEDHQRARSSRDATVQNTTRGAAERLGALHSMQGKQLDKVDEASAGDIIAVVKLKETQTGDTLSDKAAPIVYDRVEYPEAAISFAIEPKSRQDEEKISRRAPQDSRRRPLAPLHARRADEGVHPLRLGPAPHRDRGREAEEPLPRRGRAPPAEGSVQGDDHGARRGAGPPQETDRRTRPVRRLQGRLRAAAARRRASSSRTRFSAAPSRRSSARPSRKASSRPPPAAPSPATRSSISRPRSLTARTTRSIRTSTHSAPPAARPSATPSRR